MPGRAAFRLVVLMLVIVGVAAGARVADLSWPWIVVVMVAVWALVAWIDWKASSRVQAAGGEAPAGEPPSARPPVHQPPLWARLLGARPRPGSTAPDDRAAQHVRVLEHQEHEPPPERVAPPPPPREPVVAEEPQPEPGAEPEPEVAPEPAPALVQESGVPPQAPVEVEPEPEPAQQPERELAVEAEPAPQLRAVPEAATEPAAEPEPEPEPEPVARIGLRGPREWNLWDLERLARTAMGRDVDRDEERTYLLMYLREFANADGDLPLDFDDLVRDTFGDLVGIA